MIVTCSSREKHKNSLDFLVLLQVIASSLYSAVKRKIFIIVFS